ncbi:MAG: hypothetical protein A4E52_01495 [Pelotomaculum sp. PtaB.Bin013]|nr:MAG: hypothetical protein A4E52_01495 [Pelotomaculum sp. PtaB.Bin013]
MREALKIPCRDSNVYSKYQIISKNKFSALIMAFKPNIERNVAG